MLWEAQHQPQGKAEVPKKCSPPKDPRMSRDKSQLRVASREDDTALPEGLRRCHLWDMVTGGLKN